MNALEFGMEAKSILVSGSILPTNSRNKPHQEQRLSFRRSSTFLQDELAYKEVRIFRGFALHSANQLLKYAVFSIQMYF
jgi:hypothetical protein